MRFGTALLLACAISGWAPCAAEDASGAKTGDALSEIGARLKVPTARVPMLAAPVRDKAPPDFSKWAGPLPFGHLDGRGDDDLPVKTEGFLACDASRLHAAIRCFELHVNAVPKKEVSRDGNVWAADNLEMFLLPGLDATKPYYQFAVNPAGSLFDAKVNDKSWNAAGVAARAYRDGGSWTVVLSVPYAALGPEAGGVPALWRVNLHRIRPKRGADGALDLAWSPTLSRSNHVPSRFGLAWLKGLGKPFDAGAARAFLDRNEKLQILFKQTFEKGVEGFDRGESVRDGSTSRLRVAGKRNVALDRNFGAIPGLRMALAYRTAPHQHGLAIQGKGTRVRACRPGLMEVLGRGLKVAQRTCQDADGQSRSFDLGLDAFRFKRPYGH